MEIEESVRGKDVFIIQVKLHVVTAALIQFLIFIVIFDARWFELSSEHLYLACSNHIY